MLYVSIHATLAGGDVQPGSGHSARHRFYPRHPRGWRLLPEKLAHTIHGFYPRHPRGWRRRGAHRLPSRTDVSIHATLAGGDAPAVIFWRSRHCFYPRHPRGWRRSQPFFWDAKMLFLSTPPSRVATVRLAVGHAAPLAFLSTPPSRVATGGVGTSAKGFAFLSTPPSRVATTSCFVTAQLCSFLSTPPSRVATLLKPL